MSSLEQTAHYGWRCFCSGFGLVALSNENTDVEREWLARLVLPWEAMKIITIQTSCLRDDLPQAQTQLCLHYKIFHTQEGGGKLKWRISASLRRMAVINLTRVKVKFPLGKRSCRTSPPTNLHSHKPINYISVGIFYSDWRLSLLADKLNEWEQLKYWKQFHKQMEQAPNVCSNNTNSEAF